ncbi:hypothetical protein BU17DRAFT_53459 [Hysterangium stoloniferum]|nr:hypothetical protein BU17DRAFT_53459 [Hysterangium stoloniferum]
MSPVVPTYLTPSPGFNHFSIQDAYIFVLISLPLSSILIPLFLLILYFSTSSSRRTWLFALNLIIVLLGIVGGILNTISILILHPRHSVSNRLFLACTGIMMYTPIVVDCILVLRLSAVYPQIITKRSVRMPILAIPIVCTAARAILVTLLIHDWYRLGNQSSAVAASKIIWPRNPLIISDWSIQLFENFYCSVLFMYRLRGHKTFSSRMYRERAMLTESFASRLRVVFYISVSNFVFPTILSIFQLVYIIRDNSDVHGAVVCTVNNHVSIIGIVFCTIVSS